MFASNMAKVMVFIQSDDAQIRTMPSHIKYSSNRKERVAHKKPLLNLDSEKSVLSESLINGTIDSCRICNDNYMEQ